MSSSPTFIEFAQAACEQHAAQLGAWFASMFAEPVELEVIERDVVPAKFALTELQGSGLVLPLRGDSGALLVVPDAAVPLADWTRSPEQIAPRAAAVIRELRSVLFPDQAAVAGKALWIDDLPAALERCGIAEGTQRVPLLVRGSSQTTICSLLGPCPYLDRLAPSAPSAASSETGAAKRENTEADGPTESDSRESPTDHPPQPAPARAADAKRSEPSYTDFDDGLRLLPNYTRSLLRVRVPVTVTLANTRQSVRRILELGPGAIIQFKKTCEETLTLEVGGRVIAEGEAVKVGDKFGLWITSMILPKERYEKVQNAPAPARAGS